MEIYVCARCARDLPRRDYHEKSAVHRRPVMSRCRRCRREDRYARLHATICPQCLLHRPLNVNGRCRGCNAASALQECRRCHVLRVSFLDFYAKRATCIPCAKGLTDAPPTGTIPP